MNSADGSRGIFRFGALRGRCAPAIALLVALALTGGCGFAKRCAYEGFRRDSWQQPERVVEALALAPGQRVADLGAGGGYFTFRIAEAVGPSGRVYAADVDQSMTDYVQAEAKDRGLTNVSAVLSGFGDPRLPEPVDLLFTCNTYHHIEDRVAYFTRVREKSLRPGARVAIVDFDPEVTDHATARDVIVEEMQAAGFALLVEHDWLERQSFLVFEIDGASGE